MAKVVQYGNMLFQITPLFAGTLVLFGATIIFYIGAVLLLYYWHEAKPTFIVLPMLYSFNFFIIGFLLLALVAILFQYTPEILPMLNISSFL